MSVDPMLRLLALFLPPLARMRYLEEWRADAAGAADAGLSRRSVVLGAAVLSFTLDRDLPAHTGEPRGMLPRRRARRGLALLCAAGVILSGAILTGGGIVPEGVAATAGVVALFKGAAWVVVRVAVLIAVLGAVYLIGAVRTAATRTARATLVAAAVGPAAVVAGVLVPGAPWWLAPVGFLVVLLGLVGGVAVLGGTRPIGLAHRRAPRRTRITAAALGALGVIAVVVVGGIDMLIWNPLAKVPGMELQTIYATMVSRDGFNIGANVGAVMVWAGIWIALAVLVVGFAALRDGRALTPRRLAILMLGFVGGAVFFRFFAGFGYGMSIADTFGTNGGDASIVSATLPYLGQFALAAAAVAFGWAPRAEPRPAAAV
ncbi:hypothetical protein [Cryobacterium arcticum]|uniref:Uncharacterized protein n=1 Tax=Cryobacterium arcticum TaxID=670052 RepID=A0A317ZUF1_9MICO|nr:hypothetical protein [Cryobacterium arcticum]PXA68314.1 hypothetical protein CTB96_17000 [Cryobacterium arcticum]